VRIGLYLAYWPWFSAEEQVALARQADRAGLDSVWVAEAWVRTRSPCSAT
jgi:alkanesulfonate monooxygenase SsuD/methylene tetrahydromethanopterin reductase-like flavin-dependent oxidoreductase (luciferase family)